MNIPGGEGRGGHDASKNKQLEEKMEAGESSSSNIWVRGKV